MYLGPRAAYLVYGLLRADVSPLPRCVEPSDMDTTSNLLALLCRELADGIVPPAAFPVPPCAPLLALPLPTALRLALLDKKGGFLADTAP